MEIKEAQEEVDKRIKEYGGYWEPLSMLARLTEEVGELARAMNQRYGGKRKKFDGDGNDIEDEISEKGFTGDPLGLRFLREKRISGKRIYFLVYEEFKAVLMVSISDKKTQQETIDKIKVFLPEFKKLMEEFIAT